MKIAQWPLADRPREKLLTQDIRTLTDAELIAILLQFGTKGKTALDLARELLYQFGGLQKLLQAKPQALYQLRGLGKAKYAILQAAFELGKRCAHENLRVGEKLSSSKAAQSFLAKRLGGHKREIFACIFLNNHHHFLAFEELFQGSLTEAKVYPREIVRSALTQNAAKIILAHNHPSGDPTPSQSDQELTTFIRQALAIVDVQVLDHIIIGQGKNFSFAEAGWL